MLLYSCEDNPGQVKTCIFIYLLLRKELVHAERVNCKCALAYHGCFFIHKPKFAASTTVRA
jgi:hypothetical protein